MAVNSCASPRTSLEEDVHILPGDRVTAGVDDFRRGEDAGLAIVGCELERAVIQIEKHSQPQVGEKLPLLADGGGYHALFDQTEMNRFGVHASDHNLADFPCLLDSETDAGAALGIKPCHAGQVRSGLDESARYTGRYG